MPRSHKALMVLATALGLIASNVLGASDENSGSRVESTKGPKAQVEGKQRKQLGELLQQLNGLNPDELEPRKLQQIERALEEPLEENHELAEHPSDRNGAEKGNGGEQPKNKPNGDVPEKILRKFDENHDGKLGPREQFKAMVAKEHLNRLDDQGTNHDDSHLNPGKKTESKKQPQNPDRKEKSADSRSKKGDKTKNDKSKNATKSPSGRQKQTNKGPGNGPKGNSSSKSEDNARKDPSNRAPGKPISDLRNTSFPNSGPGGPSSGAGRQSGPPNGNRSPSPPPGGGGKPGGHR